MAAHRNRILQLVPQRVAKLVSTLESQLWRDRADVEVLGGPVHDTFVPPASARRDKLSRVRAGEYFGPSGGAWNQRWFKVRIGRAPKSHEGRRALFWDCRGETTAYIDGTPWAGLDVGHPYCVLPDKACDVWLDCGTYQSAIWVTGPKPDQYGLRFDGAWTACRDEAIWRAYWDLFVLRQVVDKHLKDSGWDGFGFLRRPPIEKAPFMCRTLLVRLDECCDAWDRGGVEALSKSLSAVYADFPAEKWQPVAAAVAQSHLDLVWLWPERVTHRKGIHTFATALRLLDRYPELRFMMSQPAIYRVVQRRAPALYSEVARRIKEGRWEATGAAEVEFDTILPCGEALGRSLVLGRRELVRIRGGSPSKTLWLPDVFGYSNCLPQIMALAGVPYFYTTKMSWSALNQFPYDAFVWRGADGTDVLAFLTFHFFGNADAHDVMETAQHFRQAGTAPEMIAPVGYGDGGGGPNEEFCERARRMRDLAGVPRYTWTGVDAAFDRLSKKRDELPVFQGELYLEYHRGCYTTQSDFKRAYRAAERALQIREAAAVCARLGPLDPADWRRVCFAQFHDAIPGSSIGLVYDEMTAELDVLSERNLHAPRRAIGGGGRETLAYNPLAIERTAVVTLDRTQAAQARRAGLAVQAVSGGAQLTAVRLPALGSVSLSRGEGAPPGGAPRWDVSPTLLSNGRVNARFDDAGALIGLDIDGAPVLLAGPAAFTLHPDMPFQFDAWDIDEYSARSAAIVGAAGPLRVVEKGPVRARLRGSFPCGAKSKIGVDYVLDAYADVLRVEVIADWHETHKLLRYRIPTSYAGAHARFGAPFGSVLRPQKPAHVVHEGMWEVPGSRWAAVTDEDGGRGLAVVTEAKYGFSCRDGELGLSLLRSSVNPDPNADRGTRTMSFAIGAHRRSTTGEGLSTPAMADALFTPALVVRGKKKPSPFALSDLGTLAVAWVLPEENGRGFVIRLHETMGERGRALLRLARKATSVDLVNLLEEKTGAVARAGDKYAIDYEPYKIVSVRVRQ